MKIIGSRPARARIWRGPAGVLLAGLRLIARVRDGKKMDVYNVTTPTSCSCPTGQKPGDPCGHSRIFFPARKVKAEKVVA